MSLLQCNNVSFAYDGKTVVEDLSFNIENGDYICIVGENGSGKSTLIKGLLGLRKASKGSVVFGEELKKNEIGYLPQQTENQRDFPASVYEVVLSGCMSSGSLSPFYRKVDKKRATENMKKLKIDGMKNKSYRELSGGQQQRVLLARALCSTEKILILDEPVTGLDPIVTAELYRIIDKINKENEITVIMVSHDIRSAIKEADKVLHLNKGLLFYGKVEDYMQSDIGKRFMGGQ